MKNKFIFILIFFSFNFFGQKKHEVTAKSGLLIRSKPSTRGNKIGKLDFKEIITIVETTNTAFETETIKGYWVKIKTKNLKYGYVFNGFLKPYTKEKITYSLITSDEEIHKSLKAKINNIETTIIEKECFDIVEIQDYNNDGYEEVALEMNACGGNCCGNSLLILSYNGNKFIQTKQVGYDFGGIELNYDKNTIRNFIVDLHNIGAGNTTLCEDKQETYIFEDFKLKRIKLETDYKLNTISELKSSDFIGKENETESLSIEYDLDNNGINDKIVTQYWERWGLLFNSKIILNNKTLKNDAIGSPKRIGILKSKTNNVHDLVIECDEILKWNGFNYEKTIE